MTRTKARLGGLIFGFMMFQQISLFGFVKEFGMGDTGVAYPQSATTARYNPAGILDVGDNVVIANGITYLNGHMRVKHSTLPINQSNSTTQCKWLPVGIFGISKTLKPNLAVAISTDFGITSTKGTVSHGVKFAGHGQYGTESFISILVPTVAYRVGCHDFGFSLPISIARFSADGLQNSKPLSIHPHHVTNKGYDWAWGFTARLGWLWHVTDRFQVGVSIFCPFIASSHYKKYRGLLPERGKFDVEPEVLIGATYKFCRFTITTQAEFINFTSQRQFANSVTSKAKLGSKHGPGAGYKNVWGVQLAGDYRVTDTFTVRAGFVTLITPFIRPHNVLGNFAVPNLFVRQEFGVGFTKTINCVDIDFAWVQTLPRRVTSPAYENLGGAKITGEGHTTTLLLGISTTPERLMALIRSI